MNGFYGIDCIKFDPREEEHIVTAVEGSLPDYKCSPVRHRMIDDPFYMPDYKQNCMEGEDHPLAIEMHQYILTRIHQSTFEETVAAQHNNNHRSHIKGNFNAVEMEYLQSIIRRPEIDWAMHNSFDGLYIQRAPDHSAWGTKFSISCYMKAEHVTFWKLKYSGR